MTKLIAATLTSVAMTAALLRTSSILAVTAGFVTYATAVLVAGLVTRSELDVWRLRIGSFGARRLWGVR